MSAAVRKLHAPQTRWMPGEDSECSFATWDEAAEWLTDRGETAANVDTAIVQFVICRHCGDLESWMMRENGEYGWGYREALWPCATVRALDGEGGQ